MNGKLKLLNSQKVKISLFRHTGGSRIKSGRNPVILLNFGCPPQAGMTGMGFFTQLSKFTWFLTIFFLIAFNTMTVFGSESEYETVAINFLKYLKSDKEIVSTRIIKSNALDSGLPVIDIAFLANLKNGGYILISTSKHLTPVKAYSLKGNFDTLPPAYKKFLTGEAEYNVRTLATTGRTSQSTTDQKNIQRWNFLLDLQQYRTPLSYMPDTHLLTTTWNQDLPYNKFLPEVNGEKAVAGCVNIAMGQLMKYYGYPPAGKGVVCHEWNGQQLKAILYRPYNWDNMPDALDMNVPDYKVDEVARLIRDLAIANYTDLRTTNSGASANIGALIENFGFSTGIMEMNNDDVSVFFSKLKDEIDAKRPVLLSLPGHMAVADGYASDGAGKKIHLNFGWGGHDDDYYFLDQDIITEGYDFKPELEIYYNIKPCEDAECSVNLEAYDAQNGLNISGKFDYERDADRYNVYLKGTTTITGTIEGYSNQAFYISVYDSNNVRLFSGNSEISGTFAFGRYTVRASLYSEGGSFYSYDINNDNYTVSIVTDNLTDTEKTAVDAGLDIPPVIFNDFETILLNSTNPALSAYKILIDARDENGDLLTLTITNTKPDALQAVLTNNILTLEPVQGMAGDSARVFVTASANGKTVEKSFVVMVSNEDAAFGKEFTIQDIFESQDDFNSHKVILDGNCTITGYNGYSSQAFYTSVSNGGVNETVSPVDAEITHTFTKGIYFIGASLNSPPYYYPYEQGVNDQYQLTVSCPDADDSTSTIAGLLGINLSGTFMSGVIPGDINGDNTTDLTDAVICFQTLAGITSSGVREGYATSGTDVNSDNKIGLQEAVYILQHVAGLRP